MARPRTSLVSDFQECRSGSVGLSGAFLASGLVSRPKRFCEFELPVDFPACSRHVRFGAMASSYHDKQSVIPVAALLRPRLVFAAICVVVCHVFILGHRGQRAETLDEEINRRTSDTN